MTANNTSNKADIFYLLRGFAMLLIFGIHSIIVIRQYVPVSGSMSPIYLYTPAWAGCWILFALSGYLLGKGFYKGKYSTDLNGIIKFYQRRIFSIVPMYFFALLIIFLFINPSFFINNNVSNLFTFTYNGSNPGNEATGAFWFISTIMQLYLVTPFVYKYILPQTSKRNITPLCVIVCGGLLLRLAESYFNIDWYKWTYTSLLGNFDFFFAGLLLNQYTMDQQDSRLKKYLRPASVVALLFLVICNTFLYHKYDVYWAYQYIYPTLYLIITLGILYAFDYNGKPVSAPLSMQNILNNPLRLLEGFGIISYGFYLFHSNILNSMARAVTNTGDKITVDSLIAGEGINGLFGKIAVISFVSCVIWSVIIYFILEKPSRKINLIGQTQPDKK